MKKKKPPQLKQSDLPRSVKILGQVFTVELVKDLGEDGEHFGETQGDDRKILINKEQSLISAHRTLYHECIHAALHITGLNQLLSDKLE